MDHTTGCIHYVAPQSTDSQIILAHHQRSLRGFSSSILNQLFEIQLDTYKKHLDNCNHLLAPEARDQATAIIEELVRVVETSGGSAYTTVENIEIEILQAYACPYKIKAALRVHIIYPDMTEKGVQETVFPYHITLHLNSCARTPRNPHGLKVARLDTTSNPDNTDNEK